MLLAEIFSPSSYHLDVESPIPVTPKAKAILVGIDDTPNCLGKLALPMPHATGNNHLVLVADSGVLDLTDSRARLY